VSEENETREIGLGTLTGIFMLCATISTIFFCAAMIAIVPSV